MELSEQQKHSIWQNCRSQSPFITQKSSLSYKIVHQNPFEILLRLDKESNFGGSPCSLLYSWSLDAHLKQNKWFPLRL